MPEIGTSGSMSEDGKRSVAKWPKLQRLSSTLPSRHFSPRSSMASFGHSRLRLLPVVDIANNLRPSHDNLDRTAVISVVAATPRSLVRQSSTQRRETDCRELRMHRR